MRREEMTDRVVANLAPYLGETMAAASVHVHCEKLGLGPDVTEVDLEALLSRLAGGLHVFLGREKTDRALDEIRMSAKGAPR